MKYDFDRITDRSGTNSLKWNVAENELPMWVADMDFTAAPEIYETLQKRLEHGIFGYSVLPEEWYQAYIDWWQKRHNVTFSRQHMLFSPGVMPTISTCIRELTTKGDNIVLLSPVYNCFYDVVRSNERTVLECPLIHKDASYSIDFELLEKQFKHKSTTMILLSNPHNPTGNIWDRDTLAGIGKLARENSVIVISDEIHCDVTDPNVSYVSYLSAEEDNSNGTIVCVSPTKAFNLAGLQTSAVVIPDSKLRRRVRDGFHAQRIDANILAVQAAVSAFQKGGQWLDELMQYLYENKQLVKSVIETEINELRLTPSQATYLLWIDGTKLKLDEGMTLSQSIRSRTGLYLSDGTQFGTGGEGYLRMNIACPRSVVREGLDRLRDAVRSMN